MHTVRHTLVFSPAVLVCLALVAQATPLEECVVTSADTATYNTIVEPVFGSKFYIEERDVRPPFATVPPIPGSGIVAGEYTMVYEESNSLSGLQRSGVSFDGDRFPPGCDQYPFEMGDVVWHDPATPFLVNISNDDPTQWTIDPTWATTWHVDPEGSPGVPCLLPDEDPINDETCAFGPDAWWFGAVGIGPWLFG